MTAKIHQALLITSERFPALHKIINSNGVIELHRKPKNEFFRYLAKTATGQQLSKAAATTIWTRVEHASKNSCKDVFNFCNSTNYQCLRDCGLSNSKVKTITELHDAIASDSISSEVFTTNDQTFIKSEITKLWGFGEWSANIALLSFFGFQNIWLDDDAALQRGMKIIGIKDDVLPSVVIENFTPYKSFLSLHIWKALDDNILFHA